MIFSLEQIFARMAASTTPSKKPKKIKKPPNRGGVHPLCLFTRLKTSSKFERTHPLSSLSWGLF
jgi:hypothetical protein